MKVGLYDKLLTVEELNQLKKDAATVCGHSAEPQLSELLYGGAQLLSQIYADKLLALQDSLSNKDAKEQQELLKQQATQLLFAMLQAAQALPSQFPSTPLQQLLAVSATVHEY